MIAYFQTLRSRKRGFLREKGFLAPLGFPRSHRWSSVHKKDRLTANQRASIWTTKLEIEANAVIYTHTYMHIYIQDSSKADGIGHRWPSLVTYATWISLLRSVVASQRLYGSLFEGLETSAEQVIWQSFDRCKKGKCKLAHVNNSTLQERMS